MSHSQFRFILLYLDMHGLISKSSFVDWQDQPDFNHSFQAKGSSRGD